MTKWMCVLSAGCLIVGDPGDEVPPEDIIPIGDVHPCTIQIAGSDPAYWTVCFQSSDHIQLFAREMMDGCAWNGTQCAVQCSTWSLRPCIVACPSTGLPSACNSSHGCYCPPE